MLFSSDGELDAFGLASPLIGEIRGAWAAGGDGDTETALLFAGELLAALGLGLLLRLRGPPELEPGVTASKAEPRPEGKLYGEKRWFLSALSGEAGE